MKAIIGTMMSLALAGSLLAQTAKQDMKNAGSDVKDAAKSTGHATVKGTKKVGKGVKKGVHKGAAAVENKTQE